MSKLSHTKAVGKIIEKKMEAKLQKHVFKDSCCTIIGYHSFVNKNNLTGKV